jgi:hypothetical protein
MSLSLPINISGDAEFNWNPRFINLTGGALNITISARAIKPGETTMRLSIGPFTYSWRFYSIQVYSIHIDAPPLVKVNEPLVVNLTAVIHPPISINVTMKLSGCVNTTLKLPINSTVIMDPLGSASGGSVIHVNAPAGHCPIRIEVRLLNASSTASSAWSDLVIEPSFRVLGEVNGSPIILLGDVSARVFLLNGTEVAAWVKVNNTGIPLPKSLGRVMLIFEANYLGLQKETPYLVYVVPTQYLAALGLAENLPNASSRGLVSMVNRSVITGNWSAVERVLSVENGSRGIGPLGFLADLFLNEYLSTGNTVYLDASDALVKYWWLIYTIGALVVVGLVIQHIRPRV